MGRGASVSTGCSVSPGWSPSTGSTCSGSRFSSTGSSCSGSRVSSTASSCSRVAVNHRRRHLSFHKNKHAKQDVKWNYDCSCDMHLRLSLRKQRRGSSSIHTCQSCRVGSFGQRGFWRRRVRLRHRRPKGWGRKFWRNSNGRRAGEMCRPYFHCFANWWRWRWERRSLWLRSRRSMRLCLLYRWHGAKMELE